jgi:dTDP-4-amino-4,6-dideoxygalactose transaminase
VAASVVKAGLRPRLVDIDPTTLDIDAASLERTDFRRVLAIVATNLYGLPNDLPRLAQAASSHGVFLIDDAAQALGASVGGRPSGTWGDAGLYSLDKGKNVSAIDGGLVVTSRADVADALDRELAGARVPGIAESCRTGARALVYFAFLRPWLYWIPNAVPQLGLGRTVFTTDFLLAQAGSGLAALALETIKRLPAFTDARRTNAGLYLEGLGGVHDARPVQPAASATPVYLRFPLLLSSSATRDRIVEHLNAAGVGASGSYPASLADVPELMPHLAAPADASPGGRYVADRILTLPTHSFVERHDIQRALDIIATTPRQRSTTLASQVVTR